MYVYEKGLDNQRRTASHSAFALREVNLIMLFVFFVLLAKSNSVNCSAFADAWGSTLDNTAATVDRTNSRDGLDILFRTIE